MMSARASIADSANSGRRKSRQRENEEREDHDPAENLGAVEQPGVAADRERLGQDHRQEMRELKLERSVGHLVDAVRIERSDGVSANGPTCGFTTSDPSARIRARAVFA